MTMLPDDQPPTHPFDPPARVTACLQCGGDLGGRRWCCDACVAASWKAIERAGGKTIYPSDIDRERERDADAR